MINDNQAIHTKAEEWSEWNLKLPYAGAIIKRTFLS